MKMAEAASERSHDTETKVGSVLIKESTQTLVSTGFNGFIAGALDTQLPTTRPDKYEYIIHSELNLLTNCCKNGISTNDCYIVCTMSPCKTCSRMIYNAGIRLVITKELYRDFKDVLEMKDLNVTYYQGDHGYYYIAYTSVFL
jgi:dCMP deaminase